ncbi:MAG: biotin/lipoyl-binding protein, partial [Rhodopila sp.]
MPDADAQTAVQERGPAPNAADTGRLVPAGVMQAVPALVTLLLFAVAAVGAWAMWQAYMAAPWTRDGTVRAYVVTITPEVSGRIVQLPIRDNQFVKAGDLLMTIDPTDYAIAVDLAQAAADQAKATAENAKREADRREHLTTLETSEEQKQTYQATAVAAMATQRQAVAN